MKFQVNINIQYLLNYTGNLKVWSTYMYKLYLHLKIKLLLEIIPILILALKS